MTRLEEPSCRNPGTRYRAHDPGPGSWAMESQVVTETPKDSRGSIEFGRWSQGILQPSVSDQLTVSPVLCHCDASPSRVLTSRTRRSVHSVGIYRLVTGHTSRYRSRSDHLHALGCNWCQSELNRCPRWTGVERDYMYLISLVRRIMQRVRDREV